MTTIRRPNEAMTPIHLEKFRRIGQLHMYACDWLDYQNRLMIAKNAYERPQELIMKPDGHS
jgi:hypothetical protein